MKTAMILFKPSALEFDGEWFSKFFGIFEESGVNIDTASILSVSDDLGFKRSLCEVKETADNVIIGSADKAEFDVNEIISQEFSLSLTENERASEIEGEKVLFPESASLIPNETGKFQGYLLEVETLTLAVLPSDIRQLSEMTEGYLLPYFSSKYGEFSTRRVLKYFGDEKKVREVLCKTEDKYGQYFSYQVKQSCKDNKIVVRFNENFPEQLSAKIVREIVEELGEGLYATRDMSLEERLFDALRLKKKKIATAESFTGGRIVSSLIRQSGASEFVNEGIVSYSNLSKVKRLKVKGEDLITVGAVSAQVAYQMAAGLLQTGDCDIAISTTGIAGPKSDNTLKPVGLCYIAVGLTEGVHVYKFNFTGDRENITQTAVNTALYLAFEKIKNI